jgi:hypothetical protein
MKVEGYLSEHAWGTEIELVVSSGLREGQTYVVTLVSEDGERVNAGTFIGAGDKPVRVTFNAALSREEAVRLEASTPGGEPVFFAELPEEPRDLSTTGRCWVSCPGRTRTPRSNPWDRAAPRVRGNRRSRNRKTPVFGAGHQPPR